MRTRIYQIGDIIEVIKSSNHNSEHRWYRKPGSGRCSKGDQYIVEGVDIHADYNGGYTLYINNTAYGSEAVKLISNIDLERARKVIYAD